MSPAARSKAWRLGELLQKKPALLTPWLLASGLQNPEGTNIYCFKWLSLWWLLKAALGNKYLKFTFQFWDNFSFCSSYSWVQPALLKILPFFSPKSTYVFNFWLKITFHISKSYLRLFNSALKRGVAIFFHFMFAWVCVCVCFKISLGMLEFHRLKCLFLCPCTPSSFA